MNMVQKYPDLPTIYPELFNWREILPEKCFLLCGLAVSILNYLRITMNIFTKNYLQQRHIMREKAQGHWLRTAKEYRWDEKDAIRFNKLVRYVEKNRDALVHSLSLLGVR